MIPNKCLSVQENLYLRKHVSPRKPPFIHQDESWRWVTKAIPQREDLLTCFDWLGFQLKYSSKYTCKLSMWIIFSMSSQFCSFQWEKSKAVFRPKALSKWNTQVGSKHLLRHALSPVILFQTETSFGQKWLQDRDDSNIHRGYKKDSVLASKDFQKNIASHPRKRSECPLVKMWEMFPYVIFGWQEGADVFTMKIYLLGVLLSLRRVGTVWSIGSTMWQRQTKRGRLPKLSPRHR